MDRNLPSRPRCLLSLVGFTDANIELLHVLERYREILGDDHRETIMAASNVAVNFMLLGDLDAARLPAEEALAIQREAVQIRRKVYGEQSPEVADSLMTLAKKL